KPEKGDAVAISDDVLLDESPPELTSVTIAAGGSLVWSPESSISYCTASCTSGLLTAGTRGQYSVAGFGEKFIGVADGGTLELHGKNKLSWTKLTSTVQKRSAENGFFYDKLADDSIDNNNRGLVTYILNGTGHMTHSSFTYTVGGSGRRHSEPPKLITALNAVKDGETVVMAVQKNTIGSIDMDPLYDAIERATLGEDFGAGQFVPFQTRQVLDGQYGQWSEWGQCTRTCGGGEQIRTRACDSPMPQNGGQHCSGPEEETQDCNTNPC
ncbi:hypothetical protein BaRGS_00021389, partial [Batillaria attramentaria]